MALPSQPSVATFLFDQMQMAGMDQDTSSSTGSGGAVVPSSMGERSERMSSSTMSRL